MRSGGGTIVSVRPRQVAVLCLERAEAASLNRMEKYDGSKSSCSQRASLGFNDSSISKIVGTRTQRERGEERTCTLTDVPCKREGQTERVKYLVLLALKAGDVR